MRCFNNIAKLVKESRLNHKNKYSQSELSHLLGYKNGQFISNVERALCNIPLKMLSRVCTILDIETETLKAAIIRDQTQTLDNFLAAEDSQVNSMHSKVVGASEQKTTWIDNSLS